MGGHEFTTKYAEAALEDLDTTTFDMNPHNTHEDVSKVFHRRTKSCSLRLFLMLFGDDTYYERLITETKVTPNRQMLDAHAFGARHPLWRDAHASYINHNYVVPPIQLTKISSKIRQLEKSLIIRSASPPWVTPATLAKWYFDAHQKYVYYRNNQDRSGNHDYDEQQKLQEFLVKFSHGNKDPLYIAILVNWRGASGAEFFSGRLKEEQQQDGWGQDDDDSGVERESSKHDNNRNKSHRDSTRDDDDEDNATKSLLHGALAALGTESSSSAAAMIIIAKRVLTSQY